MKFKYFMIGVALAAIHQFSQAITVVAAHPVVMAHPIVSARPAVSFAKPATTSGFSKVAAAHEGGSHAPTPTPSVPKVVEPVRPTVSPTITTPHRSTSIYCENRPYRSDCR